MPCRSACALYVDHGLDLGLMCLAYVQSCAHTPKSNFCRLDSLVVGLFSALVLALIRQT